MNGKNDKTSTPNIPALVPSYYKTMMEGGFKPYAWDFLNFGTKATIISGTIVAIQSPVKTLLINMTKNGSFLPTNPGGGFLGLVRSLYAGTSQALSGSILRTAYVTNVKGGSAKVEEHPSEKSKPGSQFPFLFWSAVGEALITGRSESTSQLVKSGVLKPGKTGNMNTISWGFNLTSLENNYTLIKSGFGSKTSKSLVNFYFLCMIQPYIASKMTYGSDTTRHISSGMLTGALATVITFPLDFYKETMLTKMTIKDGKILSPYSYNVLGLAARQFYSAPSDMSRYFINQFAKQVPVRAALTGTIFAVIAGLAYSLGEKPAENFVNFATNKRHTFFGGGKPVEHTTTTVQQSQSPLVQQEQNKTPVVESKPIATPVKPIQSQEKPATEETQKPESDSTYRP